MVELSSHVRLRTRAQSFRLLKSSSLYSYMEVRRSPDPSQNDGGDAAKASSASASAPQQMGQLCRGFAVSSYRSTTPPLPRSGAHTDITHVNILNQHYQ